MHIQKKMQKKIVSELDGEYLKQRILKEGFTLSEFQKELGISKTAFYNYRTGSRPFPRKLRQRMEQLLNCSFNEFLIKNQEMNLIVLPTDQQRHTK